LNTHCIPFKETKGYQKTLLSRILKLVEKPQRVGTKK